MQDPNNPMSSVLETVAQRLVGKYQGVFSQETVAGAVSDSWDRLTEQATLSHR